MKVSARVNIDLAKSTNYIPMGFWDANTDYYLSDLGIPFVKRPDGSTLGYSVFALNVQQATKGSWITSQWRLLESAEFIYMQNAYIEYLQAQAISLRTAISGARTEIDPLGMRVYNEFGIMNIRIGNKNGYAVLEYYDNDGTFLYDLGPSGIGTVEVREEEWTQVKLHNLATMTTEPDYATALAKPAIYRNAATVTPTTYYRYTSKIVAGINQDPTNDGKIFTSSNKTSAKLSGVFCSPVQGIYVGVGTGTIPSDMHPSNPAMQWTAMYNVYKQPLTAYNEGLVFERRYSAYWTIIRDGYPVD